MASSGSGLSEVPQEVGPYRIEGRLGAGGMGAVYRAYDARLDRPVALKQVHPAADDREAARARFRREARAAARLSHAAIVQVHDLIEDELTGDWIVMELVEGETLRNLMSEGPLEPLTAAAFGLQILQGLRAAHHHGLLHRDLKAENVMVDAVSQVKILDFGLAKNLDAKHPETTLTAEGKILGTVSAMSPEQALGRPLDERSDLFALGSLLYEMVTGDGPFKGDSPVQTLTRIVTQRQPSADELEPDVPAPLAQLIDRLLEKEPARRPDAEVIERELQALLGSGVFTANSSALASALGTGAFGAGGLGAGTLGDSALSATAARGAATDPSGISPKTMVDGPSAELTLPDGPAPLTQESPSATPDPNDSMISGIRIDPWARQLASESSSQPALDPPPDLSATRTNAPLSARSVPVGLPSEAMQSGALQSGALQSSADLVGPSGTATTLPGGLAGPTIESTRSRNRLRWVAGLMAALALVTGLGWFASSRTPAAPSLDLSEQTQAAPRPSIALLGFQNTNASQSDADWLSTAFAEMLGTELAAGESVRVVSGESVARMRRDLGLEVTRSSLAADTLGRIRRHLGTDYVLVGSFLALGDATGRQVRFDVHVQETQGGERVASASQSATEVELFDLAARIGSELRRDLELESPTTSQASAVRATMSTVPEANRLYALGLTELRSDNVLRARDYLRQALEHDESFALAHASLAEAWQQLGYDQRGEEHARKAFELRNGLPRESVLRIEAEYYQAAAQHADAVRAYLALWSFFPDNLDYGLALVRAQLAGGQAVQARETLEQLRALPAGVGDDPRLDLANARVSNELSDFPEQRDSAERAEAKGTDRGATHIVAKALTSRGAALFQLGDLDEAAEVLERSRQLNEELGQLREAGTTLNTLANLQAGRGDLDDAEASYRQALDIFRRTGNRKWTSTILNNFAHLLNNRGELTTAHRMLQESLDLALETGDLGRQALRRDSLGWVLLRLGDLDEAREQGEEAVRIARQIGRPYAAAWALTLLGEIALDHGALAKAADHLAEADATCQSIDYPNLRGPIHARLAEVRLAQGELDEARQLLDSAIQFDTTLEADTELARHRLSEGRWSLASGAPGDAAVRAGEAAETLAAKGLADEHLRALALQLHARSLAGRDLGGSVVESTEPSLEALADEVEQLSVTSQAAVSRLEAKLALAQHAASHGDAPRAQTLGSEVLDEAQQRNLGRLQLIARAFLLQPNVAAPGSDRDAQQEALVRDAEAAGFSLLAQQLRARG